MCIIGFLVHDKRQNSQVLQGSNEWEHYDKIKESIINLQNAKIEERNDLLNVIEKERVYLDDNELQNQIDLFIGAVLESTQLGLSIPHYLIKPIISRTTKRMNKRYKR